MNQAFFKRINVKDEEIHGELSEPFRTLLSDELADETRSRAEAPDRTPALQRSFAERKRTNLRTVAQV